MPEVSQYWKDRAARGGGYGAGSQAAGYGVQNTGPYVGGMQSGRIGYGVGVGGDNTAAISGLADAYQSQYDAAQQANIGRYEDILGEHGGLYERTMGSLGQRSQQAETDIGRSYDVASAAGQQGMTSRGLYNTTAATTMQAGSERDKSAAVNRYRDQMLDRQIGYDVGLTGDRSSFMERREDEYPNQGALMQMAQQIGQAGPGGVQPGVIQLLQALMGGGGGGATQGLSY